MSLEICVLLVVLISVLLNVHLINKVTKAHGATEVLNLEMAVQQAVFDEAKHCYEQTTRKNYELRSTCLRGAENEYKKAVEAAHAIGWPVPEDWHEMLEMCRPPSRTLEGCSDPTHQR